MGNFSNPIKKDYSALLVNYWKELSSPQPKQSYGLFSYFFSNSENPDQSAAQAKLIESHYKWVAEIASIVESVKAKPAEQQGFTDNKEALINLAKCRDYVKNNPEQILLDLFYNCNVWLKNKEKKAVALTLGKKGLLDKDFPACEKFLEDKTQQYAALNAEGILPCVITKAGKTISLFDELTFRIEQSKKSLAKLASNTLHAYLTNGATSIICVGPRVQNAAGGTMSFGKKLSLNVENAHFLLRGFSAIKNYIENQGAYATEDPNSKTFILGGAFVLPANTAISLSRDRPEPSAELQNAETSSEPTSTPELTTTEAPAADPLTTAESKAPRLTAKL